MLKTISAALLAVSVLAAPVLAANTGKTVQAPVTKSVTATKSEQVKKDPLNANAKMARHHKRHHWHHKHHRVHKMHRSHKVAVKLHKTQKFSAKHVSHPAKRG